MSIKENIDKIKKEIAHIVIESATKTRSLKEINQAIDYFNFFNNYGEESERLLWAIMTDDTIYKQMILELDGDYTRDTIKAFCAKTFKSLEESNDSYLKPHINYTAIAGYVFIAAL